MKSVTGTPHTHVHPPTHTRIHSYYIIPLPNNIYNITVATIMAPGAKVPWFESQLYLLLAL